MKRAVDILISFGLLIPLSFLIGIFALLISMQDGHSPIYAAERVGRGGKPFRMVKLRSMIKNADKSGVSSTKSDDARITPVGALVRKLKLDELTQLWNVLKGQMSMVGPRPNVWAKGVALYTPREMKLLDVRPGITDMASIVFADEGAILAGESDPDDAYDRLIRPWKSRLSLFNIEHSTVELDLQLMWLTGMGIMSRQAALDGVVALLEKLGADEDLIRVARRTEPLVSVPPPGLVLAD